MQYFLSGLQSVTLSDFNSLKEVTYSNPPQVTTVFSPQHLQAVTLLPIFQRHVHEHPVINH